MPSQKSMISIVFINPTRNQSIINNHHVVFHVCECLVIYLKKQEKKPVPSKKKNGIL